MPVKLTATVDDKKVVAMLAAVQHLGASFKDPLLNAAIYMMRQTDKHFQRQMGPDGPWKPLSKQTQKRRRKGKGSGSNKILQDTGRLKQSTNAGGQSHIERISDFTAEIGTNLAYAAIHQFGGVITRAAHERTLAFRKKKGRFLFANETKHKIVKRKTVQFKERSVTIPARPYLWLDDNDAKNITQIFAEWAEKKLKEIR